MRILLYVAGAVLALVVLVAAGIFVRAAWEVWREERDRRRAAPGAAPLPRLDPEIAASFAPAEIERLRGVKLWLVWYEDRFDLENSQSFGISVHLSEEGARATLAKDHREYEPGWDGCTVEGPVDALGTAMLGRQRVDVLRTVLDRLASGSSEGIPMRIE